jgi:hypothetical protein
MAERRTFCVKVIPGDCRQLLFFMQDGEQSGWLGFGSREAYCEGLGLAPEMVDLALRGLELTDPNSITPLERAVALGQHGGDRRSEKARADQAGVSSLKYNTKAHWLARLQRDRPDLAQRVINGELSANAAAIEAGFRTKLTPFERIKQLIPKLTVEERQQLVRILTTHPACERPG